MAYPLFRFLAVFAICSGAGMSFAQGVDRARAVWTLPASLEKRLSRNPQRFLQDMADLIAGYGEDGALGEDAIAAFVGLERARVRAFHVRQLMQADIDGDGDISRSELDGLQRVKSAWLRGRLEIQFRRADTDRDGRVSAQELRADASARALQSLPAAKEEELRAVLRFDLDGDGAVTLDEVMEAVAILKDRAT